ncbi:winged helix DNA-binding protein [Novosphingobium jiangmenense]|uniref:winged helix DNA-binding protein n=1 Tax=Novosphingobium jiangmenense TaxID=2791981 RepID=UPI001BE4398B|nr:winged helix DNA-binding protein [Novosphingobium jiangmenense]
MTLVQADTTPGTAPDFFDDVTTGGDVAWISPCAPLSVTVLADRAYVRMEMAEDATAAGLRVAQSSGLERIIEADDGPPLGDIVLVDCPMLEGADLAALAQLDQSVARTGAMMIVSTSVGSLDDVFGCLDQSNAQILVNPGRADRVVALGHLLSSPHLAARGGRVRELSDNDRMSLLRLTQQVSEIAQRLESLSGTPDGSARVEASAFSFDATGDRDCAPRIPARNRAPLPDPRLVRKIIRQRQLRARFFEGDLFADPAWDMLLDLTAARAEHKRVSVTSLCIASGVPPTTALRWISQMTETGLLCRAEDATDRRRAFIALSDKAADSMAQYFAEAGNAALVL